MSKGLLFIVQIVVFVFLIFQTALAQFKVIGYYPMYAGGYPAGINSIDLAKLTHVNLAFANPNGAGALVPDYGTTGNITSVVNACHARGVKVYISIGGGGASGTNYQTYLSNTANINTFVSNIVNFTTTYNLDGVDVDIEGNILNGTTLTAAQYQNFVTALGISLRANSRKMSSALGSWFGNLVTNAAAAQFDWINMMSYDLCGPWSGACQHAPYSMTTNDFQYWNTTKGVPATKLVVGLPFYGYGWGTYYNQGMRYCDIVNTYPGSQNIDQIGSGGNGLYYNGIPTIKQKTTYASQNAAGVMIWELTQDCATSDSRSLLLAVSQVLGPLPLTWLDFHATPQKEGFYLYWSTANEKGNDYFSVESNNDGLTFFELDRVKADANNTKTHEYRYLDTQALTSAYYRIKQVDSDGKFSYSSIVFVEKATTATLLFEVSPNPALDREINVQFISSIEEQVLELTDLLGNTHYSKTLTQEQTKGLITIKLHSLNPGVYILSAIGNSKRFQKKVMVY